MILLPCFHDKGYAVFNHYCLLTFYLHNYLFFPLQLYAIRIGFVMHVKGLKADCYDDLCCE